MHKDIHVVGPRRDTIPQQVDVDRLPRPDRRVIPNARTSRVRPSALEGGGGHIVSGCGRPSIARRDGQRAQPVAHATGEGGDQACAVRAGARPSPPWRWT
ncbi:MAG: hypothetical protein R3A10_12400 [Caldilineaceae bacterium]